MNSRLVFILGLLVVSVFGCRREGIRVYDAPKERVAESVQLPEGWKQLQADEMSLAKFTVRGADDATANVSVSMLPPSDETANVNRWRRQVGLGPIAADEIARQREVIQISGQPASLFDVSGATDGGKKTRILAAVQNRGDAMWFFKMSGDDELVTAQKATFIQFFSQYPIPGEVPPPSAPAQTEAPPSSASSERKWAAPVSWKEQPPGAMQEAKFSVANGKAAVTVSIFPGPTGSLRANIDRWRTQMGLPPATDAEFEKVQAPLDLPDAKATVVDMAGAANRMVTAIVRRGESTWFFKLLGETSVVESEKNTFIEFVKNTK